MLPREGITATVRTCQPTSHAAETPRHLWTHTWTHKHGGCYLWKCYWKLDKNTFAFATKALRHSSNALNYVGMLAGDDERRCWNRVWLISFVELIPKNQRPFRVPTALDQAPMNDIGFIRRRQLFGEKIVKGNCNCTQFRCSPTWKLHEQYVCMFVQAKMRLELELACYIWNYYNWKTRWRGKYS